MIERLKIVKTNQYHLLTREQYWIKRLKTLSPHGLNLRTEIAPAPFPFIVAFSDYAPGMSKLVGTAFDNIKLQYGVYLNNMVAVYRKHKNLEDFLTSLLLK